MQRHNFNGKMFTREELANAMQALELPDQVAVLQSFMADCKIEDCADLVTPLLMNIMADLDGQDYPEELIERAEALVSKVEPYNKARFADEGN